MLQDLLGGELLVAVVTLAGGARQGWHTRHRRRDGTDVDLTFEQFATHERVGDPRAVARPAGPPGRWREQYALPRDRVDARLIAAAPDEEAGTRPHQPGTRPGRGRG